MEKEKGKNTIMIMESWNMRENIYLIKNGMEKDIIKMALFVIPWIMEKGQWQNIIAFMDI